MNAEPGEPTDQGAQEKAEQKGKDDGQQEVAREVQRVEHREDRQHGQVERPSPPAFDRRAGAREIGWGGCWIGALCVGALVDFRRENRVVSGHLAPMCAASFP